MVGIGDRLFYFIQRICDFCLVSGVEEVFQGLWNCFRVWVISVFELEQALFWYLYRVWFEVWNLVFCASLGSSFYICRGGNGRVFFFLGGERGTKGLEQKDIRGFWDIYMIYFEFGVWFLGVGEELGGVFFYVGVGRVVSFGLWYLFGDMLQYKGIDYLEMGLRWGRMCGFKVLGGVFVLDVLFCLVLFLQFSLVVGREVFFIF